MHRTQRVVIDEFLAPKELALFGASRSGKKFGNVILKHLRSSGFTVYVIHPHATTIDGERSYSSLTDAPKQVHNILICTPPNQTETIVRDAAKAGINRIWMQPGTVSMEAVRFCTEQGISVITDECIMMFAEPVTSIHAVHRFFRKLFGRYPHR